MLRTQSTGLKTNNYFGLFEKESKKQSNQIGAATVRQKTLASACAVDVTDRASARCNKVADESSSAASRRARAPLVLRLSLNVVYFATNYLIIDNIHV